MSTESVTGTAVVRRLAVVLADYGAASGAPSGVDPGRFAAACLADCYEVVADLEQVTAAVCGGPEVADLLWPGSVHLAPAGSLGALAVGLAGSFDELVAVPADVPDLPGLIIAKVFKALRRAEVCLAPERGGVGCVALGVRLPWPAWLPPDTSPNTPATDLAQRAPTRRSLAIGPDWHRLRTPAAISRLDPGLEGWDQTRALLFPGNWSQTTR